MTHLTEISPYDNVCCLPYVTPLLEEINSEFLTSEY